jgi:hypothetical protein
MAKHLEDILEMQFNLMYYLNITIADFDNNDIRDNEWLYSRLAKQKKDEQEAMKDKKNGR